MKSYGVAKGIQGKELQLIAEDTGGAYKWNCKSNAESKYLPASCR
jgi:hypothetical protein